MFAPPSWQHQDIVTNGVKLHYVTQGDGPLMLMLHGFPEFWYSWRHQIPEFARDYKVVAIDLRGYNDSDKPADPKAYRMSELILDVKGVVQGLGYESCVLVGHDWGGAIAWCVADAYPAWVDRLIVLNLPHPALFRAGLLQPQQFLRSTYAMFFQLPWLPELLLQANDYELIRWALRHTTVDPDTFSTADLEAYRDAIAKPGALTAALNYYRNAFSFDFFGREWHTIQIPTLLIWGENDVALGVELTHGTDRYVEDLTIRYIPNCSHWVQQERPQLVNQYMREFLAR